MNPEDKWDPYKESLERKLLTIRELCNEILKKDLKHLEEDEIYYFAEMVKRETRV